MEYDMRNVLEFYDGHGNMTVNGLRWDNMGLEDAADSVGACGGRVEPEYVEKMRCWLDKADRRG